jgi:hypothetical protein
MSYKKRTTSKEVERAENRMAGIKQYNDTVTLGTDLTEVTYTAGIDKVKALTKTNNDLLTQADGVVTNLKIAEKELAKLSSRFLNGVGSKYGYDSVEYEKAGGVRTSDIKKKSTRVSAKTTTKKWRTTIEFRAVESESF